MTVPYKDDKEDLDALLAKAIALDAPLVYVSNPDNPMGTYHTIDEIEHFVERLPSRTMLILDEAYCEMAPSGVVPVIDRFLNYPNVLRMRTFSKAYGMAGQRIGYCIGSEENIAMFDRVRNHFGMNKLGQLAALAAVEDQSHAEETIEKIDRARERLYQIAQENGFIPIPSAANFVTMDCGRDGDYARQILAGLIERGVFVRMPSVAPLDRCIRVSVGPDDQLDKFAQALADTIVAMR